jgi:hypothetical protein
MPPARKAPGLAVITQTPHGVYIGTERGNCGIARLLRRGAWVVFAQQKNGWMSRTFLVRSITAVFL